MPVKAEPTTPARNQYFVRLGFYPEITRGKDKHKSTLQMEPGELVELSPEEAKSIEFMIEPFSPEAAARYKA